MKESNSLAALLALMTCSACAQDAAVDAAALELTAPAEIAQVRLWRIGEAGFSQASSTEQLGDLSPEQLADLLRARTALVGFFRELANDNGDPFPSMTADFARRHPDTISLYQSVIGQEATLLQLAITGFAWSGQSGDALELFFVPTIFSEGDLTVGQAQATLRKAGTEWLVANVGPDDKGSGFLVEKRSSNE